MSHGVTTHSDVVTALKRDILGIDAYQDSDQEAADEDANRESQLNRSLFRLLRSVRKFI